VRDISTLIKNTTPRLEATPIKYMQKYIAFFKNIAGFFRPNPEDGRKWSEKLRDKYRLVVMNDDTFEEVSSFKLSPLNVYVLLSSLVVLTAFLVTMLIVYTPLKRYIPGYGDFTRDSEVAELQSKRRELEETVSGQQLMIDNMRKISTGDLSSMTREAEDARYKAAGGTDDSTNTNVSNESVERIEEDAALRQSVAAGPATAPATVSGGGAAGLRDIPLEQLFFMPSVTGEITAGFDPSKNHYGIDVAAPRSSAIKAAADGVVFSSGFTVETGYSIAIQHPNNVITVYKHNSVLLKKEGSPVKAGEAIAIIGNTGEQSTGPHLHFELWYKGSPVNPADYINFKQ
jgi:murein DD-endopeptidase MepM/ murein hydrolase activator NlpD